MKHVNAMITKADVRFYPDVSTSQLELTLTLDKGTALFRAPMDSDTMFRILSIFNKDSVSELNGQYCRVLFNDDENRIEGIMNIVFDEFGELQNDPAI